jgi:ankyrin repeat protein
VGACEHPLDAGAVMREGLGQTLERREARAACPADRAGSSSVIEAFISAGVGLEVKDDWGWTPAFEAVMDKNLAALTTLAEADARLDAVDRHGRSLLHVAVQYRATDAMRHLLDRGVDVNAKDCCGDTPSSTAIQKTDLESVRALIEKGADVNVKNGRGLSPFLVAAGDRRLSPFLSDASYEDADQLLPLLKEHGANVNDVDKDGNNALHMAVSGKFLKRVKTLVALGVDPHHKNLAGQTPLDLARGSNAIASYLKKVLSQGDASKPSLRAPPKKGRQDRDLAL